MEGSDLIPEISEEKSKKLLKIAEMVCVTGASGFLGSWLIKFLLDFGFNVRALVRKMNEKTRISHLEKLDESRGHLEIMSVDLEGDIKNIIDAVTGCSFICHVAGPNGFQEFNGINIIEKTTKATENLLLAVKHVKFAKKVLITSCIAAIRGEIDFSDNPFTEEDWNSSSTAEDFPYQVAKTSAEREAWRSYGSQFSRCPSRVTGIPSQLGKIPVSAYDGARTFDLITFQPGLILGPLLCRDHGIGSPQALVQLFSSSKRCSQIQFPVVDVRDVAAAHIIAIKNESSFGRYILMSKDMWVLDMAKLLQRHYPKPFYDLPSRSMPIWETKLKALGIKKLKLQKNMVGKSRDHSNEKARRELNMVFISPEETILDTAKSLEKYNFIFKNENLT